MKRKILFIILTAFSFSIFSLCFSNLLYAQVSDTARDQKEAAIDDQRAQREDYLKPKTAEEVLAYLKEKAEELKKEKRRKELLNFKFSTGYSVGLESNPANDAFQKGDEFSQEDFSASWVPTFNKQLSGDATYRLSKQNYHESEELSTFDHTISGSFKWNPFKSGKLVLTPLQEYDWLIYPFDSSSSYEQTRTSLDWKHYAGKKWSWGGKYEWSRKEYDKKAARDIAEANLNYHRVDFRNSIETWVKWYIGKYSVTLKEKTYRNNANDEFTNFQDWDDHRGYITIAASFMKDGKLYLSHTSDYEIKAYTDRLADEGIGRHDQIIQHKLSAYYTLNKLLTLNPSVTYKKSGSNDKAGAFKDVTYKVGLTADF